MKHYQIKFMDEDLRDHFLESIPLEMKNEIQPVPYKKRSILFLANGNKEVPRIVNVISDNMKEKFSNILWAGTFSLEVSNRKYEDVKKNKENRKETV